MITIPMTICGDIWVNPTEVKNLLENTDSSVLIRLDFQHEGPSMYSLGIVDMLNQYCADTGRNPGTISIIKNPNKQEHIPYKNSTQDVSHFFDMSRRYWTDTATVADDAKLFGYFMGRRTFARARILYDLWHQGNALLSVMDTVEVPPWVRPSLGITLEQLDEWLTEEIIAWLNQCPVTSIDGHTVRDQYVENPKTNADLLNYYNKFQVEIVTETYTLGNTFFPTEKTVRPIMAAKPFLIYGPKNYLQRLKDLGFETYSNCWDESYDQYEGPDRWQAMKHIMSTVAVGTTAQSIAQQNRMYLAKMVHL